MPLHQIIVTELTLQQLASPQQPHHATANQLNIASAMSSQTTSPLCFEGLPVEIQTTILSYVLLTSSVHSASKAHPTTHNGYLLQTFRPCLDTAILRTNKAMYTLSKNVLDTLNKWIVFDLEDASLAMQPITGMSVPHIFIDPEPETSIPQGIMRVRVKLGLSHSASLGHWVGSDWPVAVSRRQIVLGAAEDFRDFLIVLRSAPSKHAFEQLVICTPHINMALMDVVNG